MSRFPGLYQDPFNMKIWISPEHYAEFGAIDLERGRIKQGENFRMDASQDC